MVYAQENKVTVSHQMIPHHFIQNKRKYILIRYITVTFDGHFGKNRIDISGRISPNLSILYKYKYVLYETFVFKAIGKSVINTNVP